MPNETPATGSIDPTGQATPTPDPELADDGFPPVVVAPPTAKRGRSSARNLVEWVVVVVGALVVALLVNAFLFQPFRIPSASMYPALKNGDRVVVNKLSYRAHPIHRGDVVVFTRPDCKAANEPVWASCNGLSHIDDLIKRVIGIGGDHIDIHDNRVFLNGKPLDEPYVASGAVTIQAVGCAFPMTYTVPKGDVFVMGDNRQNSQDGRCFGPIPNSSIVGRAFVRIWPFSRLGWL